MQHTNLTYSNILQSPKPAERLKFYRSAKNLNLKIIRSIETSGAFDDTTPAFSQDKNWKRKIPHKKISLAELRLAYRRAFKGFNR